MKSIMLYLKDLNSLLFVKECSKLDVEVTQAVYDAYLYCDIQELMYNDSEPFLGDKLNRSCDL